MVCLWKLVKAYQRTRQSTYICPPVPHVIEAFNHKVNHNSHKELGTQEHAVLQYTRALQYVSYCNDERYKDHVAPAEEGPQQGDSDVVVEEEVEESMETDEPSNIDAPAPLPGKAFLQSSEAEAEDDRHSHASEESTDQNPPHNSDLNEDELLGPATDISIPRGTRMTP